MQVKLKIKRNNKLFKNLANLEYLATTLINQNCMHEEIRAGSADHHSAQNILSSNLVTKNIKINIYRTVILPVVLCGCKIWSLTLNVDGKT
jgi:hypothetical protein